MPLKGIDDLMTIYDIIILAIVGLFALWGLWKGLITAAFNAAGLIVGILASWQLAPVVGKQLPPEKVPEFIRIVAASILILLVVYVAAKILAYIVKKIIRHGPIKSADRLGGFLVGAAKGALLVMATVILVLATPLSATIQKEAKHSPVLDVAVKISNPLVKRYKKALGKSISRQVAKTVSNTTSKMSGIKVDEDDIAKIVESMPDLKNLTVSLDTISPETEALIKSLLKDQDFSGLDMEAQFDMLKASGSTVDISLEDFPPETRAFINQALQNPQAAGIDLKNVDLDQLKAGSGGDIGKLIGNAELERLKEQIKQ
ncbi:CvpA family protein [Calditrichota bacterium]